MGNTDRRGRFARSIWASPSDMKREAQPSLPFFVGRSLVQR